MPASSQFGLNIPDPDQEAARDDAGIILEQLKSPNDDDIAAITSLWIATGLIPAIRDTRQDIENCINADHGCLIIARHPQNHQIIATMMTGHDSFHGWIHYLAINPDAQNLGIGRELAILAEDILRASGLSEVRITIENPAAGDFYAKLGYDWIDSVTDKAPPERSQNMIMRKSLDQ
jgi:ribosomal protein S18 acetylase RimI-like enzyme